MGEFFQNIPSIESLIGLILIALSVDLATKYIKPQLDKALALVSSYWRDREKQKSDQWKKEVDELRGNLENQVAAGFNEMRHRIRSMLYWITAVALVLFKTIEFTGENQINERGIVSLMFLVSGVLSLLEHIRASKITVKLNAANNKD